MANLVGFFKKPLTLLPYICNKQNITPKLFKH